MAITTLAMVATVFVSNLYEIKDRPVPKWAKKIFIVYVARLLCMCSCLVPLDSSASRRPSGADAAETGNGENNVDSVPSTRCANATGSVNRFRLIALLDPTGGRGGGGGGASGRVGRSRKNNCRPSSNDRQAARKASHDHHPHHQPPRSASAERKSSDVAFPFTRHPSAATPPSTAENIGRTGAEGPAMLASPALPPPQRQQFADFHQQPLPPAPAPTKPNYSKDWIHVAAVCDRFFFWLCLTFIVITTLMLFHPLTTSQYFKIPIIDKTK